MQTDDCPLLFKLVFIVIAVGGNIFLIHPCIGNLDPVIATIGIPGIYKGSSAPPDASTIAETEANEVIITIRGKV